MKLFSILLSSLLLVQSLSVDFGHIVQLDELMEHAQFHKARYGDNFIVFISKHYGEQKADHEKQHQEEKKEHEELPFNHHSCLNHSILAFVMLDNEFPAFKTEFQRSKNTLFHYQFSFGSLHGGTIFQPPKQA